MSLQLSLFPDVTPDASPTDGQSDAGAVDELFASRPRFRSSLTYTGLLRYIGRLSTYSMLNGLLLYLQDPAATVVATAGRWRREFGRRIAANARPLIILAPMSPVRFVYDVRDTEGPPLPDTSGAAPPAGSRLPADVFAATVHNSRLHGIAVHAVDPVRLDTARTVVLSPEQRLRWSDLDLGADDHYLVLLEEGASVETRYCRLAVELGHLFCGHCGIHSNAWWPERPGLAAECAAIEAESTAFLVCHRRGLLGCTADLLRDYALQDRPMPLFSLSGVLQAAQYIEAMGRRRWQRPARQGRYRRRTA